GACLSGLAITPSTLTTAKGGAGGFAALSKTRPRLVILDDNLDDQDGPSLLHTLHQQAPEVLIIYLATCHSVTLERTVRQLGVLYYTEKPLDSLALSRVLEVVFTAAKGEQRTLGTPM